jgi:hypothetical protein
MYMHSEMVLNYDLYHLFYCSPQYDSFIAQKAWIFQGIL